ncbi:hypothetical protein Hypma_001916 [Hypsizygus marmoreus]|uniref:Uncharacterized protein n=1 Tax=Hypsizygus marmoreus TaxID=39966 RepID=A0A369J805_HYPMA|nr:hypothetical protein Hypma_001916 [Hypsizygus marmoreus]
MSGNFDPVGRSAQISVQIREAIRGALPTPPEQFFTVMIPGKVVNFKDFSEGFDPLTGELTSTVVPNSVELNQAMLCDDMPALSTVQLGPTGKSVARSYAAALGKLVPAGTTVGVEVADVQHLTDKEKRYQKAMDWLTSEVPDKPGMSRVELYTKKQFAYTAVVENKTKAFNDALKKAQDDPVHKTALQKRASYDAWVSENARTYRNYVQAAYMDWVITGKKEEVEYWFSVVDQDSALARVEQSKEAMRAAVVQDTDGSCEFQRVKLTPSGWAVICQNKALSGTNQTRTVEWYTWEISRLVKMNAMLEALKVKSGSADAIAQSAASVKGSDKPNPKLQEVMATYVSKREAYEKQESNSKATYVEKKDAYDAYNTARTAMKDLVAAVDQENVKGLTKLNQAAQDVMFSKLSGEHGIAAQTLKENQEKIKEYERLRQELTEQKGGGGNGLAMVLAREAGVPDSLPDPESVKAKIGADKSPAETVDYFTPITVEITSSSSTDSSSSEALSASLEASYNGGFGFSANVSASHSNSTADASSAMAKNSCKVSFECMRVDITRPWLRAELFYDSDLVTGTGDYISPGFSRLRELMEGVTKQSREEREAEMELYSTFPMYPTAFLVACNVVLEISGETTAIQSHFSSSSTSASASLSYGPFKVSSDFSHTKTQASSSCESTASGCRITVKSPQIIGWISQMVPALPRLNKAQQAALQAQMQARAWEHAKLVPSVAGPSPSSTKPVNGAPLNGVPPKEDEGAEEGGN